MEKNKEYYEALDKRTAEFKEWKKSQTIEPNLTAEKPIKTKEELEAKHAENAPAGLGDLVEKITEATGLKKLVKFVAGEDCGCDERKVRLNKLRFRNNPLCLEESEYSFLHSFFIGNPSTVTQSQNIELTKMHARVFNKRAAEPTSCSSCMRQTVSDLREIYNTYE